MLPSSDIFILAHGRRRVLVFRDQCPRYLASHPSFPLVGLPASLTAPPLQDDLALARSTFYLKESSKTQTIVIAGTGPACPWDGTAELSKRAWMAYRTDLTEVTVDLV
jgi:hypothetical protein